MHEFLAVGQIHGTSRVKRMNNIVKSLKANALERRPENSPQNSSQSLAQKTAISLAS
jgi:hypothetical protein